MRRRRHVLQVSTFPFLAVLLCAMGSLILLLLVIDRRAKAVARAKAWQALARVAEEERRTAEGRAAECERRRQALRSLLARQDAELKTRIETARMKTDQTVETFRGEELRSAAIGERLQGTRSDLERAEKEAGRRRERASQDSQQQEAARQERTRLTTRLEQLEQLLEALKAARRREQQTYSVVPYRGKHGDNRRPLYVECTARGLILHPEREAVENFGVAGEAVRVAVERRLARQQKEKDGDKKPYLLLLVRPDGITNYYRAQAALRGLDLDFGYEFIEQDWQLDFPTDDQSPITQPWMASTPSPVPQPSGPARAAAKPPSPVRGVASIPSGSVQVAGSPRPGSGPGGTDHPGMSAGPSALAPSPLSRPATASPGRVSAPAVLGPPTVALGKPESALVGQTFLSAPASAGQTGMSAPPDRGNQPGTASPTGPSPAPKAEAKQPGNNAADRSGRQDVQRETATGVASSPGTNSPPTQQGDRSSEGGGNQAEAGPGSGGSPSGEPSGDPLSRLAPPALVKQPVRPAPVRLGRSGSSRDWIITIECTADAVTLQASRQRFAVASLARRTDGGNPLQDAVRDLIARRQATVRPGELPYRPQVRFVVRPDGLRSYYVAFPALEGLGVPMTRENPDPEEARPAASGP